MKTSYLQPEEFELLKPVGSSWMAEHNGELFGIDITIDDVLNDLIESNTTVICLHDGPDMVGFLALFATECFLGSQKIAVEKYWYVKPDCRTGGVVLLKEAVKWARENECSHLIMSASNLAIVNLYASLGFRFRNPVDIYHRMVR